jgi:hypothetical protein
VHPCFPRTVNVAYIFVQRAVLLHYKPAAPLADMTALGADKPG